MMKVHSSLRVKIAISFNVRNFHSMMISFPSFTTFVAELEFIFVGDLQNAKKLYTFKVQFFDYLKFGKKFFFSVSNLS
jgi:hypothetical protein